MVRVMPEQGQWAYWLEQLNIQFCRMHGGPFIFYKYPRHSLFFLQPSPGNTAHATVPRTSNLYGECVSDSPSVQTTMTK